MFIALLIKCSCPLGPPDMFGTFGTGIWSDLSHLTSHAHAHARSARLHLARRVCDEDPRARHFQGYPPSGRSCTSRSLWGFWRPRCFSGLPSEVVVHHQHLCLCFCMFVRLRCVGKCVYSDDSTSRATAVNIPEKMCAIDTRVCVYLLAS